MSESELKKFVRVILSKQVFISVASISSDSSSPLPNFSRALLSHKEADGAASPFSGDGDGICRAELDGLRGSALRVVARK